MNFEELIEILMKVVIIPAIPILTAFLVNALRIWVSKQAVNIGNDLAEKYILEISEIILQAVMCTSQTYVDSLKQQGKFDEEAQKIAFNKTKDAVMVMLTEDAKEFIKSMYGDLDLWIDSKIEQAVKINK